MRLVVCLLAAFISIALGLELPVAVAIGLITGIFYEAVA
jgi:hypothetical protein|tara:strand:+ start:239 stop:355 length:117 start_codon:yes stop_codon:yes gene_type:complete